MPRPRGSERVRRARRFAIRACRAKRAALRADREARADFRVVPSGKDELHGGEDALPGPERRGGGASRLRPSPRTSFLSRGDQLTFGFRQHRIGLPSFEVGGTNFRGRSASRAARGPKRISQSFWLVRGAGKVGAGFHSV